MNNIKPILIAALVMMALILSVAALGQKPRTLHNGHYTYKQLQRRGYACEPFKGSRFIMVTKDTILVNIKPIQ